ncbi:class I SAM-dependent methyltransferase [Defluviimonas salinarum]|uniref:Methyltransferase domain-containing protein n=1 Tax=Defluviimonas salinarum TaxID=2992147 RepID=A0ABT3J5D7_9RHOB|nr:methyltransferase domain-containing protein [Defluviimonas salinarum]MCW3782619.1 methyltransferase domain-containing protein [Defluviimonas salinarum]
MEQSYATTNYGGDAPCNYQKFFVPSIGRPVAEDLVAQANLKSGEHVLDVGCGTGVVTRMAAGQVLPGGTVTGLDLNQGMLATARVNTAPEIGIDWVEADAAAIPLDDALFDVVLCQMSLQFITNKIAALREMRRVLKPSGRILLNVPGPKPLLFAAMNDSIARRLSQDAAAFLDLVFAMHDPAELRDLFESAGFKDVSVTAVPKVLTVPKPEEFLWQYVHSSPMASDAMDMAPSARQALEDEVCPKWSEFVDGGKMQFKVGITTVRASA